MTVLRTKRRRVRNVRPEVLRAIHDDLLTGASARQVREALEQRYQQGELPTDEIPSERTIVNIRRDLEPDDSPTWQLEDAMPGEAWPVLETLFEVDRRSNGRVRTLTQLEARLIANVRTVNPRLGPWQAYSWVRWYLASRQRGSSVWAHVHDLAIDGIEARQTGPRMPTEAELGLIRKPGIIDPVPQEEADNG
jgi:hypothetical protein